MFTCRRVIVWIHCILGMQWLPILLCMLDVAGIEHFFDLTLQMSCAVYYTMHEVQIACLITFPQGSEGTCVQACFHNIHLLGIAELRNRRSILNHIHPQLSAKPAHKITVDAVECVHISQMSFTRECY